MTDQTKWGIDMAITKNKAKAFNMGLNASAANNWKLEDDKGSGVSQILNSWYLEGTSI